MGLGEVLLQEMMMGMKRTVIERSTTTGLAVLLVYVLANMDVRALQIPLHVVPHCIRSEVIKLTGP